MRYAGLLALGQDPIRQGNIDLQNRPVVRNPDGSYSTVRSMSFGTDEGEVLVPTVADDGRNLTEDEAINEYYRTGRHLGIFRTPDEATSYAQRLHQQQEQTYGERLGLLGGMSPTLAKVFK